MIKAIITDIDGVMVGKKHGVNFPLPNETVINELNRVHKKNIPIILCTAKFQSGILELVKKADLRNPHITDGGALIIDPLSNRVIKKYTFDKKLAQNIVNTCLTNDVYTECYGIEDYFVQKDQICDLTEKHALVMQRKQKVASSLEKALLDYDIIKVEAFAKDTNDIPRVQSLLKKFNNDVHQLWTMHPTILPFQICVMTVKDVSKKAASLEVLDYLKISPDETLGIGDTLGDWNFMEICKYAATVGNESSELKNLVKAKGEGNYFLASSVDEDGILDLFDYFKI
jgi:HAD superfamily hydrolase (TIGR01484 family)